MRKGSIAIVLAVSVASVLSFRMISTRGFSSGERTEIPGLFVTHHSIHAGELAGATPYHTLVELINRGPTTLRVETARPDCACTSVEGAAREIPPNGAPTDIPVTVDINALPSGKFHKSILFRISDGRGRDGEFVFQVFGTIDRSAALETLNPVINFGTIPSPGAGNDTERTLYLSGPAGIVKAAPFAVDFDAPSDKTIELSRVDTSNAQLFQAIHVRLSARRRWAPGSFRFTLSIHPIDVGVAALNIPVTGEIIDGITASPAQLLAPEEPASCSSVVSLPPGLRVNDVSITARGAITYETNDLGVGADGRASFRLTVHRARRAAGYASKDSEMIIKRADGATFVSIPVILLPPQRPLSNSEEGIPITLQ